jgi:ABC-type lipoprotein release transport system permease subunit
LHARPTFDFVYGNLPGRVRFVLTRTSWPVVARACSSVRPQVVWASKFVGLLIYGLEPRDPFTLIAAVAVLATVAGLAAWFPARRAVRIEPATVLRES